MKILKCPKCKSENITFNAAGQTGKYECKDCGYIGPLVLEVEAPKKPKEKRR